MIWVWGVTVEPNGRGVEEGNVLRRFLYAWSNRLPARYIDHKGVPYLERYYVATVWGRRVYLHRFIGSDPDGLHDHPFLRSWSFILAGWYWEDRWSGRRRCRWFNRIGPNDFHRVVLPDDGHDVWTLFVHTERVKSWGFLRSEAPIDKGADPLPHNVHRYTYEVESSPNDPGFSIWHKTAPTGKELRRLQRCVPLGMTFVAAQKMGKIETPKP